MISASVDLSANVEIVQTYSQNFNPVMASGNISTSAEPRPLGNELFEQLHVGLVEAYSKDDFARMLIVKFDVELENIADGGGFEEIVFNVMMYFKRRGWLSDLVDAVAKDRKRNVKIQSVAEQWKDEAA